MMQRAQILFDPGQYALLKQRSRESGCSIGQLVREAVEKEIGGSADSQRAATMERLLAADPLPAEEWSDIKEELIEARDPMRKLEK